MEYSKHLPERPFRAILNGTKKVEGRVPSSENDDYQQMKPGEKIIFENQDTGEKLEASIMFVHRYPSFRVMLESEGAKYVLSSEPKTVEHGIESYNSIPNYKENIVKFGVYAIGVVPIITR